MMYSGEYTLGSLVTLAGGDDTVYVITWIYPCMLSEDEYDGESTSGRSFAHLPESELVSLGPNQKLDTIDDDYDRAMKGI